MGFTVGTAESSHGVADFVEMNVPTIAAEDGLSGSAWAGSWLRPDAAVITVAQPENRTLTFDLYCFKSHGRWAFNQHTSHLATARAVRAMAGTANWVKLRQRTLMVSACSSTSKKLKLYVQEVLADAAPYSAASDARRGLRTGAGACNGARDGHTDDSACQDLVAWADAALTSGSGKTTQVGLSMSGASGRHFTDTWAKFSRSGGH